MVHKLQKDHPISRYSYESSKLTDHFLFALHIFTILVLGKSHKSGNEIYQLISVQKASSCETEKGSLLGLTISPSVCSQTSVLV